MSKNRILYFSALLLSVAIVFVYSRPVSFLILYSVLSVTPVSFFFALLSKKALSIAYTLERTPVLKNETVKLKVDVRNGFFLPSPCIKLVFGETAKTVFGTNDVVFSLNAFSRETKDLDLFCKFRGEFNVCVSKIEIYDFLGVFKFSKHLKKDLILNVYPSIRDLGEIGANFGGLLEAQGRPVPFVEDYSAVSGVRKYMQSDSMKRVHWKISAKKNEIMTKHYENVSENSAAVLINLDAAEGSYTEILEIEDKIVEMAASAVYTLVKTGTGADFYYDNNNPSVYSVYETGEFDGFMTLVSGVKFEKGGNLVDLIDFCGSFISGKSPQDKTNYIVFTHSLGAEAVNRLMLLAEQNSVLLFCSLKNSGTPELEACETAGVKVRFM